jgi:hypothetical protein
MSISLNTFRQVDGTINLTTKAEKQAGTIEYEEGLFHFYPPKSLQSQSNGGRKTLAAAEYDALAWAEDNLR